MIGKRLFRVLFTFLGILCGVALAGLISYYSNILDTMPDISKSGLAVMASLMGIGSGLIFFLLSPKVARSTEYLTENLESATQERPLREFVFGVIGLVVGLMIAFLISQTWANIAIPIIGLILSVAVYIFLGYTGWYIGNHKADDFLTGLKQLNPVRTGGKAAGKNKNQDLSPKILDTSVIIDGRIADILKTGFIEGQIVIPEFVLVELRHIADSADSLKRNRGRRGLDVLNKIQTQFGVEIYNTDNKKSLKNIPEVDVKLLELASLINGKVVTNDYNLNKVAAIKGVPVLNINELANTLKPVVLPGETMTLTPIREGKDPAQALAYLDDGTMIVVEDGRNYIGQEISVTVTSVLQTSAGRMIFARKGFSGSNVSEE